MHENRTIPILNYHHLQYFWAVARDGNLTRTARRLRVAQSALSAQIHQLEEALGQELFRREGRGLALTEAGRMALAGAELIFSAGEELAAVFARGRSPEEPLRVGAVATLSRNFQRSFLRPLMERPHPSLRLEAGSLDLLVERLQAHALDVVLANRIPSGSSERRVICHRLARQPVSVVAARSIQGFRFPQDLAVWPLIVPGPESDLRAELDALCLRVGVTPNVVAEVDDMAMIRLLVRDGEALGLVPTVVVRDELRDGRVTELCTVPEIAETFYAVTVPRRFPHPLLAGLLAREATELLSS